MLGESRLSVGVRMHDGEAHVRLSGDLDLSCTEVFERELGHLEASDPATIRVDLSDLRFVDSTGLRLLVALYRRCLAARRVLWLTPGPPSVQRMFEVTLLDRTLPFAEPGGGLAGGAQSPPD